MEHSHVSGVDKLNADSFTWAQYISTSFPKNILQDYKTSHEGQEEIDLEPSDHEGSDDDIWVATKVATQLIQGRYPLHEIGFNVNGRLPCEAPPGLIEKAMEDGATQPWTQPVLESAKQEAKDIVSEGDEADILCMLYPSSTAALRAVEVISKVSPQHVLQNQHLEAIEEEAEELDYEHDGQWPTTKTHPNSTKTESDEQDSQDVRQSAAQHVDHQPIGRPSQDLALRMSSRLRDPCQGFVFGRNATKCDLLLTEDGSDRLSNNHFRIFVKHNGVLMLEDTSTNGTYVDGTHLRSPRFRARRDDNATKTQDGKATSTRTLGNGSVIAIPNYYDPNHDGIRFIVKFPARERQQEQYNQNLFAYLAYINQAERQLQVAAHKRFDMPPPPLLPFNPMEDRAEASPNASMLAAATADNNHGLGWNGGDIYNIIKPVGKGAFAMVYQLSSKKDGELYACKQLEKRRFIKDGALNQKIHNEVLVMKDLVHPHIVKYVEYHETKAHILIIMEFVHFGDLSVYTDKGTVMPEYMCQMMAAQIIGALAYLHGRGITHRDIKPDNILVASHNPYTFKLSDFGLSKIVENEETFLKSFCGTLLYCAPEIYPGFQRVKMGLHPSKRERSWEPRKGTIPYEYNVDTWSIAAVLFHLLCGRAPYTGTMDDEGANMLLNIMRQNPNWERLEQAGISPVGIDFVRRSLVIDPTERAREVDLLRHPWLTGGTTENLRFYEMPGGDDDEELDASQLSIHEDYEPGAWNKNQNDEDDPRERKRSRYHEDAEPQAPIDLFGGPNREQEGLHSSSYQFDSPSADQLFGRDVGLMGYAPGARLFGEIGSSALRSSGVLGNNAGAALGMVDPENDGPTAIDDSYMDPEMEVAEETSFIPPNLHHARHSNTEDSTAQHQLQYPQLLPGQPYAGAAPSLYGAEALVDQMKMGSPRSSVSGPSVDTRPVTPQTPHSQDALGSQAQAGLSATSAKSSLVQDGQQHLTPTKPYLAPDISLDGSEIGAQLEDPYDGQEHTPIAVDDERYYGSHMRSISSSVDDNEAPIQYPTLPVTSSNDNSQESAPRNEGSQDIQDAPEDSSQPPPTELQDEGGTAPETIGESSTVNSATPKDPFKMPGVRFGILTPVSGSIDSIVVRLNKRATSFGRDPKSTVTHPDNLDERVPINAFDLVFWHRGIEKDVRRGKNTWHMNPNVVACISTRTRKYIKVNGVRLMKGDDGYTNFGRLFTGDVIEILGPAEGVEATNPRDHEFLQFRCEFFVGRSKHPRKTHQPFKVETRRNDVDGQGQSMRSLRSTRSSTASRISMASGASVSSGTRSRSRSQSLTRSAAGSTLGQGAAPSKPDLSSQQGGK